MSGFRWAVEVEQGDMAPRGYGRAWPVWARNTVLFMPVPLNFIAGLLRSCWMWLVRGFPHGGWSPRYVEAINRGRQLGYEEGFRDGRSEGWNAAFDGAIAHLEKRP